jgi:UDP-N-acetylglucosamine 2-epimerase (non-hydrolysing)
MNRVALVVGTRPEAIKLASVERALRQSSTLLPILISTGQHRELLDTTLDSLSLTVSHDLALMQPDQAPNDVACGVFERLPAILEKLAPVALLVQGDTTSAFAAALVAHHMRIPVAHVEAGLRTHDLANPFPEEANRQIIDRVSTLCFAPTELAVENLLAERIAKDRVHSTGSTAVDSLLWALERSSGRVEPSTLLLTLHRRESFGAQLEEILLGVRDFLEAVPQARVLFPVHPNPNVEAAVKRLGEHPRLRRVSPLPYLDFVGVLASSRLVLTDSGGIQEEAPSLGKALLVARDRSERTERPVAGSCRIVGRDRLTITLALRKAWQAPEYEGPIPAPNPYGDGRAGERIAAILERAFG